MILPSTLNKHILVGISGGIAAYKVCEIVSTLAKAGADVRVILTESAQEFITPLTFATLSRHRAYTDQEFWQPTHGRPLHIQLGEWADVFLIAPLTANTLAKLASGFSDNLLTNTVLASSCPVLLAPAMNREMWKQISVQRNWQTLFLDPRFHGIAPSDGILACDLPATSPGNSSKQGAGRMAEPKQILAHINSLLNTKGKRDLIGKQILISAGGTREHLDPVRFIGNPSTGKMGLALVQAAIHRGASVTFVHGPMNTELVANLPEVELVSVTSGEEMYRQMLTGFPQADITVMAAAVGDVKPAVYSQDKLPKALLPTELPLEPIIDIVAELGKIKQPHQKLVGFAAQTGEIVSPAEDKLHRKNLDVIVANPIDLPDAGFGSETNQGILLSRQGQKLEIGACSKLNLAHQLFDFIADNRQLTDN
ncbi:bifunctional phosphopantothenoylcysteine decarboxylase/phosphopantothenate--cysteine ligase CoaBC [Planktothrix paucivesiculata]|uniref:Coenzyme A biosynthesis bifunctional protein CoaBC n=1 Tax=Planktothrix paucivesiculata PCC 9631 TaxID=671071 RepID=A0A7Z9BH44_9CYAN|nr:bifunctional phosphopantothenoylcysteine decarboxylase/phosphopantothenate--cysteine ligase CoaBC [Planktothrix paucivesiculata]VXD10473.1 Coenzyme A biosynthesis bifunctional protein CoaBC (Includes: Phosphopantothenoylcysteine decarboxylase; Phosphopantothenate--cysteine ligase) [Planktothrix paucivesiculata PCC 9631]